MPDADVYRIARLLIEEFGAEANNEVRKKLEHYTAAKDYNAIKTWYEIEDALNEIQSITA
jgi:hypothetical protein